MKLIFTSILAIGVYAVSQGQQTDPSILQQSQVEPTEFQSISSPASITGREYNSTVTQADQERIYYANGPLSPHAIPINDDCANAISLTINAACTNGSNKESTIQVGENSGCQGAITKSVWYKFVATSTSLYVEVERTASSGCYLSSAVFSGGCLPATVLSCEDAAFGPNLNIHNLTGLTIGATYLVQVSYTAGGPCGNNGNANTGADFCIKVGRPVNCGTCASPCGPMCVFATTPTVPQVTATCTQYPLQSRLNAGQVRTQCYTFTSVAASFSLQMIINTVGCGAGNVTTFDWQLYPSNCSGVIQSGNLSNLNATGLTIGASYVLCYTWTAACQHNSVYPYMVATAPLPIELIHFDGNKNDNNITLNWITASEINNNYFSIQRSSNGFDFTEIGKKAGAGNSNSNMTYFYTDNKPNGGINYYRLVQYDYDNSTSTSQTIALKFYEKYNVSIGENPVIDLLTLTFDSEQSVPVSFKIVDQFGKTIISESKSIREGISNYEIPVNNLSSGVYYVNIEGSGESTWLKFSKAMSIR